MYRIGVDVGGTKIAAGVVDSDGKIVLKNSIATKRGGSAEEITKDIAALCDGLIKESGGAEAIGIGSPGTVDPVNCVIMFANNINFENFHIRDEMKKYTDLPVHADNDANCAAYGEYMAGAAKGYDHSITITLGTGIGGGVIINGKIFAGSHYGGTELGHHVIRVDGEKCTCGRKGCWEAYASATALIRDARRLAEKDRGSAISRLTGGDLNMITAKTPFDAADEGDKDAAALIDRYLRYVAEGIANMNNIFQPEIFVIGGGVCYQGERIRKPISDCVNSLVYGVDGNVKIVTAALGNDAGIVGAAMLGSTR